MASIVVAQGAQILAGIATARAFGPAGKGIINYAGVFAGFAIAGADGLRNAIAFQIGNEGFSPRAVWATAQWLLAAAAPLGSLIFLALWSHDRTQPAFLYTALVFPFALYLQTVNVLYLVRHAVERINVQNAWTVGAGSSVVIVFAIVVFHATIAAVLIISFAGFVVAAVWAATGVRTLLADTSDDPAPRLAPQQLSFGAKGGLSSIVTLLALRIDILVVGSTTSKTQLGLYATAIAVAELLLTLSRSVTWATTGRIATETRERAIALVARVMRSLVLGQAAAAVVLALAGPWAISLLYGARFTAAGPLLAILLPRVVFYSADGVLSYFIAVRQGRPGVQFAFELGTLALCAGATFLALHRYGLLGAACAATTTFVLAFAGKLAYFARVSGASWREIVVPRVDDVPARVRSFFQRA